MPKPLSLQIPARPATAVYGVDALALVPVFRTREAYQQFTGEQAPPFNPDRPVKRWYTTDPITSYQSYDTKPETPVLRTFPVYADQAALVNIPGPYIYPKFEMAPSGAYYMLNGTKQYLPPTNLASRADADRIAAELRAAGWNVAEITELERVGMFGIGFDSTETRRIFSINANGTNYNVAGLMADQFYDGVGAPGYWRAPGTGPVDWIPNPAQTRVSTAAVPDEVQVPMRELQTGERWHRYPFALQIMSDATPEGQAVMNEKDMAKNVAETLTLLRKLSAFLGVS